MSGVDFLSSKKKLIDPLDVVRNHYLALNSADVESVMETYHPDCQIEGISFDQLGSPREEGNDFRAGCSVERLMFTRFFDRYDGAFEGGRRLEIRTLALIEMGWVHAEWRLCSRRRSDSELVEYTGYSHFFIEDGLIRRQRTVAHRISADNNEQVLHGEITSTRQYPERPIVGVGAVVFVEDSVVLVKRRFEPLAGQWSLPGGSLEVGETLEAGVAREILEETGLEVQVGPVIEVFDRILLDEFKRIRYHFVLVDYLCRPIGGRLKAASDVDDVVLAKPSELTPFHLTPKATAIIIRAVEMTKIRPSPVLPE